jgi:hypothetical protein
MTLSEWPGWAQPQMDLGDWAPSGPDTNSDRQDHLVVGLPFSATRGPVARRIAEVRANPGTTDGAND